MSVSTINAINMTNLVAAKLAEHLERHFGKPQAMFRAFLKKHLHNLSCPKVMTTRSVLKEDISRVSRDVAIEKMSKIYASAMGVKELPKDSAVIKILEEDMYKEYRKRPQDYIRQVAKLSIFLDPKHHVGQFADTFRSKMLQSTYAPERFFELDISDMLPEVFLNPKASTKDKLEIYRGLNQQIIDRTSDLVEDFNFVLDPTATRATRSKTIQPAYLDKKISQQKVDIKDLCENPYWKMKKVNMIICKESGKFYCLDIETLLVDIAKTDTAVNYFTESPLDPEIVDNLKNRYRNEIAEIKDSNYEAVSVGYRTDVEKIDIADTLQKLQSFQVIFNKQKMLDSIELFGFDQIEDPSVGGKDGLLQAIPPMILEEFHYSLDHNTMDTLKKQVNEWLDTSINEIKNILEKQDEPESPESTPERISVQMIEEIFESDASLTELIERAKELGVNHKKALQIEPARRGFATLFLLELLVERGEINEAQRERVMDLVIANDRQVNSAVDVFITDNDFEDFTDTLKQIIKGKVTSKKEMMHVKDALKPGSVAKDIYDRYVERFEDMQRTINELLQKTNDHAKRQELTEQLQIVNRDLREFKQKDTIESVILMLEQTIRTNEQMLNKIEQAVGMGQLYPQDIPTAQQDIVELQQFIQEMREEIARIRAL